MKPSLQTKQERIVDLKAMLVAWRGIKANAVRPKQRKYATARVDEMEKELAELEPK